MTAPQSVLMPERTRRRRVVGASREALAPLLEEWAWQAEASSLILVAEDDAQAERYVADIAFFGRHARPDDAPALRVRLLPDERPEAAGAGSDPGGLDAQSDRLAVLQALLEAGRDPAKSKTLVVATPGALAQPVPSPESLQSRQIDLAQGQRLPLEQLVAALERLDYDSESLCEAPGQFARRGGLVDLYPVTADTPYRVDFFGDEIESIRRLDPVSQRSGEATPSIVVPPSPRLQFEPAAQGLLDYLPSRVDWAVVEPEELLEAIGAADARQAPAAEAAEAPGAYASSPSHPRRSAGEPPVPSPSAANDPRPVGQFWARLKSVRAAADDVWTAFSELDLGGDAEGENEETVVYEAESLAFYRPLPDEKKLADERLADEQAARQRFLEQAAEWARAGETLVFVASSAGDESRIRATLEEAEPLKDLEARFWRGDLERGFRIRFRPGLGGLSWPLLQDRRGAVFITETELFGRRRQRRPLARQRALVSQSQIDQLLDFAELVEGEFVVHLQHGIALYRGLKTVEAQGQRREALALEFDEGVVLYVPLQESHLVSRYVGLAKTRPRLGRIGSNRWEKTRRAAERATLDLAAQLLEVQAKRQTGKGHAFAPDTPWQREFEAAFPFKETPDQLKAIEAVKADMEKPKPMDRLLCGDVGYGKTEVALRAAFKAVMDGKQVAVLVPTTVLAQQHFLTFRDRLAGYPMVVELLSRFRRPDEAKRILQALKAGKIDILIGTHRLIQKDVRFADLGLVVVDEEQRFGVQHKEVFKRWRESVDLLSMSATPIPRTLYLALTGARELSVIETPPLERKPVQTLVKGYDDQLVRDVVRREIARGGQVFYLHNRVQTIDAAADRLRALMPEISFGVGHGQMDERELERVMVDFVDGRYQALVCTTIIESGLDIPNCNTILIEGADRFGLSQLYQLRGRVGRFKRQAYAYLLLRKRTRLMDVARQRLQAIRQHNQLGAGFRIAMRDLELRGAGNLLGPQQSGHIVGVGFELYCQLLKQSVSRLKGEDAAQRVRASVKLDFIYQGEGAPETSGSRYEDGYTALRRLEIGEGDCPPMQARIPSSYVAETRLRIDLYRRLALAEDPEEVRELREAMDDRFGPHPPEVEALLKLTEIRCLAERRAIVAVESQGVRLKCRRASSRRDDYLKLGSRFPRLRCADALKRLDEIIVFLGNCPKPSRKRTPPNADPRL